jgi:hypothetical protein
MANAIPSDFRGDGKRLDDIDLPRIGATIGVGEDPVHAMMDVEARGRGFDRYNRPQMLFEPHVFYRELGPGSDRERAVIEDLAYRRWGHRPYPRDSYDRLRAAMRINREAALRSASWGLGQVMGFNCEMVGFASAEAMVANLIDDEETHLELMIRFITAAGIDNEMRAWDALTRPTQAADCADFARAYNGEGYARHGYHRRLAERHNWWRAKPDTPFQLARVEIDWNAPLRAVA